MADDLVQTAELHIHSEGCADLMPESKTGSNPLQRRIEFHQARKHFNGLNTGGGDFRLETLNPGSSNNDSSSSNQGQSSLTAKKTDRSEFFGERVGSRAQLWHHLPENWCWFKEYGEHLLSQFSVAVSDIY
ncbi:hypothetical protein ACFX1R_018339 [Malus domestica]